MLLSVIRWNRVAAYIWVRTAPSKDGLREDTEVTSGLLANDVREPGPTGPATGPGLADVPNQNRRRGLGDEGRE